MVKTIRAAVGETLVSSYPPLRSAGRGAEDLAHDAVKSRLEEEEKEKKKRSVVPR